MKLMSIDTDGHEVSVYFNSTDMNEVTIQNEDGWAFDLSSEAALDLAYAILALHSKSSVVEEQEKREKKPETEGMAIWVNVYPDGKLGLPWRDEEKAVTANIGSGTVHKFVLVEVGE